MSLGFVVVSLAILYVIHKAINGKSITKEDLEKIKQDIINLCTNMTVTELKKSKSILEDHKEGLQSDNAKTREEAYNSAIELINQQIKEIEESRNTKK